MIHAMLAHNYTGQDITGWYMSEKLDGVRAIWDGKEFHSRNNKPINAPQWFKDNLPNTKLDGELWIGRGQFQKTVSVVRKKIPLDYEWYDIKYLVFDTICSEYFNLRFAKLNILQPNSIFKIVAQTKVGSISHMHGFYDDIIIQGGEGIILKNPNSLYEFKRSKHMLKVKPSHNDECILISYQPGEGKYIGMVGSFICQWKQKIIELGTGLTDYDRANPPDVGSILTFKYQELTDSGTPRFPVFLAVRNYLNHNW